MPVCAPQSESPTPIRPWVVMNMAMSADGKIASANRKITRLGSDRDLAHLYQLRSTADAILCGARTVEESQATLGNGDEQHRKARLRRGLTEFPLRILASGSGSLSPDAEIWSHRFSPIIVLTTRRASSRRVALLRGQADHLWISPGSELDFAEILKRIQREFAVRRLLVEGGGELNFALLRAGLVDELHLTLCPLVLGGRQAPTIADGPGIPHLTDAARFVPTSLRRHGNEMYAVFRRATAEPAPAPPKVSLTRARKPAKPT